MHDHDHDPSIPTRIIRKRLDDIMINPENFQVGDKVDVVFVFNGYAQGMGRVKILKIDYRTVTVDIPPNGGQPTVPIGPMILCIEQCFKTLYPEDHERLDKEIHY